MTAVSVLLVMPILTWAVLISGVQGCKADVESASAQPERVMVYYYLPG
jgi:hypothetical protein